MSSARPLKLLTPEEYLELEQDAPVKHEYVHGFLYAQAGASREHNKINGNLYAQLWPCTAPPCDISVSDMKVRVADDVFYYPDIVVTCAEEAHRYYDESPCIIIEVLSATTAAFDKRDKLWAYMTIPSLGAYIMVDSRKRQVQAYYRQGDGWLEQAWEQEGEVHFPCLNTSLSLAAIYQHVFET